MESHHCFCDANLSAAMRVDLASLSMLSTSLPRFLDAQTRRPSKAGHIQAHLVYADRPSLTPHWLSSRSSRCSTTIIRFGANQPYSHPLQHHIASVSTLLCIPGLIFRLRIALWLAVERYLTHHLITAAVSCLFRCGTAEASCIWDFIGRHTRADKIRLLHTERLDGSGRQLWLRVVPRPSR